MKVHSTRWTAAAGMREGSKSKGSDSASTAESVKALRSAVSKCRCQDEVLSVLRCSISNCARWVA